MADRYQDRDFGGDLDRGMAPRGPARGADSDPLAELARLIGQSDPFASAAPSRANARIQPRAPEPRAAEQHAPDPFRLPEDDLNDPLESMGPPPWVQRGARQEPAMRAPVEEPAPLDPLQALNRMSPAPVPQDLRSAPARAAHAQPDPSRYDDALFGQLDERQPPQDFDRDQGYQDDPYAFQDGYEESEAEEEEEPRKRSGLTKVIAVLLLGVVGTGGAFAYRNYVGGPRSGEPPIIRADNTPTKIVPSQADLAPKVPDRMVIGDRGEKIVPREEAPVDVNARAGGPRVVFPPLGQSANAAPMAQEPVAAEPPPSNGTMSNSEPRRIKTLSVRGDQGDPTAGQPPSPAAPATKPAKNAAPVPGRNPPSQANASANAPMSLSPQAAAAPAPERSAATAAPPSAGGGSYLVQVSSQKTEADAQASFRALQNKYPNVMGQYSPVIRRAEIPDKGTMYRAMVGPFASSEEANQFCSSLKSAGGQCLIARK